MRANKFQKIVAGVLIFSQLTFWPALALAFVSTAPGALSPVPINDTGSITGNTAFDAPFTTIKTTYTACNVTIKAFEVTDNAARLGFSFSSIIGGGGALAVQLQAEITAYNAYLNPPCLTTILQSLDKLTAPNTYTSTLKQQLVTQVKADAQTYQAKLKIAHEKYDVASQSIWKALLITVLLKTSKTIANQLVNRLVNNYKIANIKQYTDSLSTLAYDNQFIRENFPDAQSQLMARAILTNPSFRNEIQPGIYAAADNALGYNPDTVNLSDPSFYSKMAAAGSSQANPYVMQTSFVAGVDQSHSNAQSSAQQQISQGNGYKAPVNCAGSLAQQKAIDSQSKALSNQLADRKALLKSLTDTRDNMKNFTIEQGQQIDSEVAKAQTDYNKALAAWNSAPSAISTSSPAIIICEGVSSPAVLVNQGIDSMFKAMGTNISQYNGNNLPSFLSAIGGIATQIGSSMVLGGITGSPAIISESQALSQASSLGINFASQSLAALDNGIIFNTPQPTGNSPNEYELSWEINTAKLPTASYVTIKGTGVLDTKINAAGKTVPNNLPLSGSYAVTATVNTSYKITVYHQNGSTPQITDPVLASEQTDLQVTKQTAKAGSGEPAVAGASITRRLEPIRGPVGVSPRGAYSN